MNFANVKSLTIPEGSVKKITIGGVDVWSKGEAPVPSDPWEALFASINRGTYKTDYEVGDLIPLDLGTEGNINMQIAGFDCDTLAAGGNYAAVSLISKELLNTSHRMNPSRSGTGGAYNEGTGSIGGWEKSEMRTYLDGTIKPLIPTNVRSAIKAVHKTHPAYNTAGTGITQTTDDYVWIPSYNEMFGSSSTANQPRYAAVFPDSASRMKTAIGATSPSRWWLRSAYNSRFFHGVNSGGSSSNYDTSCGVALGFCVGVGAPLPSAAMLLNTITRPTAYNPALDDGEDIPGEQALTIITGGEN